MALLQGSELEKVVALFERRGVFFYHACQLKDFRSYLALGGIPSRNLLEVSGTAFTDFDTDTTDRVRGMWSKVFGNISDFGLPFSQWRWIRGPLPNPYGPILLVARPAILLQASDVAICLRSAGAQGFDRALESLSTADDVDRLFVHALDEAPNDYATADVKFSADLKREFGRHLPLHITEKSTLNPEISCTVRGEALTLDHLYKVVVDEYRVNERRLLDSVKAAATQARLHARIWPRRYKEGREAILADLATVISGGINEAKMIAQDDALSTRTRDWAQLIVANGLDWQFKRFARYLCDGTLAQL